MPCARAGAQYVLNCSDHANVILFYLHMKEQHEFVAVIFVLIRHVFLKQAKSSICSIQPPINRIIRGGCTKMDIDSVPGVSGNISCKTCCLGKSGSNIEQQTGTIGHDGRLITVTTTKDKVLIASDDKNISGVRRGFLHPWSAHGDYLPHGKWLLGTYSHRKCAIVIIWEGKE